MNDVTVIIPCGGHHAAFIGEAVESALQAGADHIIVVDDYSQPAVDMKSDHNVTVLTATHHIGRSAARNLAAEKVTTEWMYFLDADDWMEPTAIQDFRKIIACHKADIIYADYHYRSSEYPDQLIPVEKPEFIRKRNDSRNLVNIGMFVKRNRFDLIGGFTKDICMGEYWDFFLRYTANPSIVVHKHTRPFFIARAYGSVEPNPTRALQYGCRRIARRIRSNYYMQWKAI